MHETIYLSLGDGLHNGDSVRLRGGGDSAGLHTVTRASGGVSCGTLASRSVGGDLGVRNGVRSGALLMGCVMRRVVRAVVRAVMSRSGLLRGGSSSSASLDLVAFVLMVLVMLVMLLRLASMVSLMAAMFVRRMVVGRRWLLR